MTRAVAKRKGKRAQTWRGPESRAGTVLYTTGEAARALGVTMHTVARMIDSGHLEGFRLPTLGRDRRVPAAGLVRFLTAHRVPVPDWLHAGGRNVAFGISEPELPAAEPFTLIASPVALGVAFAQSSPLNLFLAGDDAGLTLAVQACRACREQHPAARVVLLLSPDQPPRDFAGVDFVFQRPANWELDFGKVAFGGRAQARG